MSFRNQSGQPEVDPAPSSSASALPEQLSGDVGIRRNRVDALRAQIEGGTYKVDSHALAKALFENLFRS